MLPVSTTPEISTLLALSNPLAIGVSGGKDSCALALRLIEHLREVDYRGKAILIHSDLGRVEWKDSLPTCQRLADATGLELAVIRPARSMMDRWIYRWHCNVARYTDLLCVKVILPWSTPAMRFCTAEEKEIPIGRYLALRYPGCRVISATGIRREESAKRAKAPVTKECDALVRKSTANTGLTWNPIIEWKTEDVFAFMRSRGFRMHEAYETYGSTRVSCAFCIMSNRSDLRASANCVDNHDIYREMVRLEVNTTFAFQSENWLGDVAPELLDAGTRELLRIAKEKARQREELEKRIPKHLLYTKGWPTIMPTNSEAELLADVRRQMGELLSLSMRYTDAPSVLARYAELMAKKPQTVVYDVTVTKLTAQQRVLF